MATLTSLNNVPLLASVDVILLMKTAVVVENRGHCIYSIRLKCYCICFSQSHLVIYIYIYAYVTLSSENDTLIQFR